ncbi:hypothetical protein HRbin19_01570 [bacterium HR19]|nr:hypothetical protein HRbin19_01570 [bacterium HR19]
MAREFDQKIKAKMDELIEKYASPPPQYLTNLINMLKSEDDKISVSKIALELAKDPVITADTIRMANSAYYGFSQEIRSLEQAIVVLGKKSLLRLIIAAWAKKIASRELKSFRLSEGELVIFSITGAFAAVKFGEMAGLRFLSDVIFTAGALRTIGRVIMDGLGASAINQVLREILEKKISFHRATKNIFGFSHNELGAYALRKWGIPEELAVVVDYYPYPSEFVGDKTTLKIISCVHLGDVVAMQIGEGAPVDSMMQSVDKTAFSVLQLDNSDYVLEKVYEMVLPEVDKIKDTFQIRTHI